MGTSPTITTIDGVSATLFDGNGCIRCNTATAPDIDTVNEDWNCSVWIRPASYTVCPIAYKYCFRGSDYQDCFYFLITDTSNISFGNAVSVSITLNSNTWYLLEYSHQKGSNSGYAFINGKLRWSGTEPLSSTATKNSYSLCLGGDSNGDLTYSYKGYMRDFTFCDNLGHTTDYTVPSEPSSYVKMLYLSETNNAVYGMK